MDGSLVRVLYCGHTPLDSCCVGERGGKGGCGRRRRRRRRRRSWPGDCQKKCCTQTYIVLDEQCMVCSLGPSAELLLRTQYNVVYFETWYKWVCLEMIGAAPNSTECY